MRTTTSLTQADILAAIQAGTDITALTKAAELAGKREEALETYGLIKVALNFNMAIKHSKKTGRHYALGNAVHIQSIRLEDGEVIENDELELLGNVLDIDLGLTEGCKTRVETHRATHGGNTVFEFTLAGPARFQELQVRFPKGHDFEGESVYKIDPEVATSDVSNWTSENTGHPVMKLQLKIMANGYLSTEIAQAPALALPKDKAARRSRMEQYGAVNQQAKNMDLGAARAKRELEAKAVKEGAEMDTEKVAV